MSGLVDNNFVDFSQLEYGSYVMLYDQDNAKTENVKFHLPEFNRLYVRRIRLPDGRGNIVYLLTDDFEKSLRMIANKNFVTPPTYRRFYYPWITMGSFFGRRYRINVTKLRGERVKLIKDHTKLIPHTSRHLQKTRENVFFCTSDIYNEIRPIMEKYSVKKIYTEFYSEFVDIIKKMTPDPDKPTDDQSWNNRVLIIDADAFGFKNGAPLAENKTNPLFLLYLAFMRTRDLSKLDVDLDMLITSKNMFLKFNPKMLTGDKWSKFRLGLFKIMKANLDDYTDQLTPEEQEEIQQTSEDHIVHSIIDDTIAPFTKMVSPATKGALGAALDTNMKRRTVQNHAVAQIKKDVVDAVSDEIGMSKSDEFQRHMSQQKTSVIHQQKDDHLNQRRMDLFDAIHRDYKPLAQRFDDDGYVDSDIIQDHEDDIRDDISELMNDDDVLEDVLNDIQDRVLPLSNRQTAPLNSARDKKLREEQKKVVVGDSTVEEILSRDTTNIPIQSDNKSAVLTTSNTNMHNITFTNFDKTFIEELYTKSILACFDSLKDKSTPFYIVNVEVEDTSNAENLQETWTVTLVDEVKKRHTIKVDIPKFYNNRFMLINGNKNIILKQNFYNPLVKDSPNTVIMTSDYNKVTIQRKDTKSLRNVEKIFSLVRKTEDTEVFISGDSSKSNLKKEFISSLEYDELSRRLFKFAMGDCHIYFSREYIQKNFADEIPSDIKGDEFFIGFEGERPVVINEDTGLDRNGRYIIDIIYQNLSDDYKAIFNSFKPGAGIPKQPMFVEAKLAGQFIPVVVILITWIGISRTLDTMGINWQFNPDMKRIPKDDTKNYVKFSNGILEYESHVFAELILNGLMKLGPDKLTFESLNTEEGYVDYLFSIFGNYTGILQLRNFYEFMMDPTMIEVCQHHMLPTNIEGLFIHAVKLLADNDFNTKASDQSYRVRSVEVIPGILYSLLANQYMMHVKTGRRQPMTISQRSVISRLQKEKMVDEYSTLNPAIEVGKMHTISSKGFRGSNSEHSYDEQKRSYDPSSIGKIGMTTSADANVGINRSVVIEPTLSNVRGYRDQVEDPETLKDVNIFTPVEMLTPGTARNEDPIRTAIAAKQSEHLVPVADASPALVSNGFDEALQFHLSNDFVINAEEDGEVVEVDEKTGFIMVRYESGKCQAINTNPEVVKNSGGGFYIANTLKPAVERVGQKFKKDEVLAFHDKYFRHSKLNGLRYAIGPLVKMAFMSSYNTYEDAGICTSKLADRMKTNVVYLEPATFKKNSNILHMVKIGDHVNIGDTLIKFDRAHEDDDIMKLLTKLSEERRAVLEEETSNDFKAGHAGTVIDIKVYTLHDTDNLSPSLADVVNQYFQKGIDKKEFLEKYDNSAGIIKAGYMLTDTTEPTPNRYNTIKNKYKGVDVLIEIYIEHSDVMGVGDKIALYSANKQIVSEIIPDGYEPYSEFRPDEEISVMTSPGTISRRMTTSVIQISAAMKCMVELKRKIAKDIRYK